MPTDKLLHFIISFLASLISLWLAVGLAEGEALEQMIRAIVGDK